MDAEPEAILEIAPRVELPLSLEWESEEVAAVLGNAREALAELDDVDLDGRRENASDD